MQIIIVMNFKMNKNRLFIILSLFLGVCVVGCSDDDSSVTYTEDYTDALISKFQLPANSTYATGLADVYFSIVQQGNYEEGKGYVGQIFNADSLAVGTVTSSLLANITTQDASEVMLFNYNETTKEYSDSSLYSTTDSIDFTYPLFVRVTAANRTTKKFYEVKVNVHQQEADSIDWTLYKNNALSDFNNVTNQKALSLNGTAYWFTSTLTNVYVSTSDANTLNTWSRSEVSWSGTDILNLSTMTIYEDEFYCLTQSGVMLKSTDGVTFASAMTDNTGFVNIIGVYGTESTARKLIAIRTGSPQ